MIVALTAVRKDAQRNIKQIEKKRRRLRKAEKLESSKDIIRFGQFYFMKSAKKAKSKLILEYQFIFFPFRFICKHNNQLCLFAFIFGVLV